MYWLQYSYNSISENGICTPWTKIWWGKHHLLQVLIFNSFKLVLRNNSSIYLNKVKCEKQILLPLGFEPTTSCILSKSLFARPQGPHENEQTTPRLIAKAPARIFSLLLPESFWRVNLRRKILSKYLITILASRFSSVRPLWSSGKSLAANAGSNPTDSKICFSHFTLFTVEWNVKNCLVNLYKTMKINKSWFRQIK